MSRFYQRQLVEKLYQQGIRDEAVLSAMFELPRTLFVDEVFAQRCFDNQPIPIGEGQTLSQPYIVAKMTELLGLQPHFKVLEIGTGSGYQTALLAKLCAQVYSVERIKRLQWQALRRFKKLDLHNIHLRHADGWQGWAERGPFDAIIVTAAAAQMPYELILQLKQYAKMVLPVGEENDEQELQLITRIGDQYQRKRIEKVRFVPLIKGDVQ
ncbi:protein-L-isoaspartate(D-aspartate) O-methyltransferase [Pasteurellaceae bacterium HPA106]|uniref:protein-L-isoaspartate(D-aspartate) O-methyltransferase n=1 Tax=Spirabiliibacterium pneumoniae TaxID=221400 RepID=UPI001AAC750D|nr:protein-L-isoaspartate(D-aspartate) O-methyltransferase [Spirabiliibacterium pneumoniae]MBE2897145.1 protein-L-isoaspartate(D-aspartate) O-methyltransferase [Spirabiliibacterium pneumoniae]